VLFAVHPLEALASNPSRTAEAQLLWDSLEPTLQELMSRGRSTEVCTAIFALRENNVVRNLGGARMRRLLEVLRDRVRRLGRASAKAEYIDGLEYASEMVAHVAQLPNATDDDRDWAHAVLDEWAALGVPKAIDMARMVRTETGQ
jgi:hypothetical protein